MQENYHSLQNYVFTKKWRVVAVKDHVHEMPLGVRKKKGAGSYEDHTLEESKTEDRLHSRGDKGWGQLQRGSSVC